MTKRRPNHRLVKLHRSYVVEEIAGLFSSTSRPFVGGWPGYKSRLQYSDAEYFNLSDKDTRVATAQREARSNPGADRTRSANDASHFHN